MLFGIAMTESRQFSYLAQLQAYFYHGIHVRTHQINHQSMIMKSRVAYRSLQFKSNGAAPSSGIFHGFCCFIRNLFFGRNSVNGWLITEEEMRSTFFSRDAFDRHSNSYPVYNNGHLFANFRIVHFLHRRHLPILFCASFKLNNCYKNINKYYDLPLESNDCNI